MHPPEDDIAAILLARAEEDIALVRSSLDVGDISNAIVGFHAQQAAEKLLKAVLARRRVTYPFTHDLERLLELVEGVEQLLPPGRDSIVDFTPWAVEFRYSEATGGELDRLATLVLLEEFLLWARNVLDRNAT